MVKEFRAKAEFEQFIKETPIAVCDFFADWCAPCRHVAPLLEKMEKEFNETCPGKVGFCKLDVDVLIDLAQEMQISAMPTFLLFMNGELQETIVGANVDKISKDLDKLVLKLGA
ncbi:unnamed protein product [Agarophyton chilense]